jgi:hypothetical protein
MIELKPTFDSCAIDYDRIASIRLCTQRDRASKDRYRAQKSDMIRSGFQPVLLSDG